MRPPKINKVKLNQLFNKGKTQKDIAIYFGVSEGAVSKAKKELTKGVVKNDPANQD